MKFKKLYSAVYHDNCTPFNQLLEDQRKIECVIDPDDLDPTADGCLIIWGGADINPEYYRHPMHSTTRPGGMRDRVEWALIQRAIEIGMPIIGVCRGAQMACAAAGGFLLQNVRHHGGHHFVHTLDNEVFTVNSLHHQMMAGLEGVDHELVAWRQGNEGAPYGYRDDQIYTPPEGFKEAEFVYFPKINCYAIQWHPEMMQEDCVATKYVLNYITKKEKDRTDGYAAKTLICDC